VVKEVEQVPAWFRPVARRLLAREARAYQALAGLCGVPRLLARHPDRILLSFVAGVPLPSLPAPGPDERLFDALESLLSEVHARGVACADLHHRNVIVDASGRPHLVDFALAVTSQRPGWLFRRMAELDRGAALRMRLRYLRRAPTAAERDRLKAGGGLWRAGRAVKRLLGALRRAPDIS